MLFLESKSCSMFTENGPNLLNAPNMPDTKNLLKKVPVSVAKLEARAQMTRHHTLPEKCYKNSTV